MAFTKRHYEEVARIIRDNLDIIAIPPGAVSQEYLNGRETATRVIQARLRRMFAADNPRFDPTRFDMACEPKGGDK